VIPRLEAAPSLRQPLGLPVATSLATAALLALTAIAGLLFGPRGLYTPDPATLPAFLGQDAITLLAILPLLLWSLRPPGVARCVVPGRARAAGQGRPGLTGMLPTARSAGIPTDQARVGIHHYTHLAIRIPSSALRVYRFGSRVGSA
jgi:hypothetical protein